MAASIPGYRFLGKPSERYATPDGREISRRQYENEKKALQGWKNWYDYQKTVTSDPQYRRWLTTTSGKDFDKRKKLKRSDSEFNRKYLKARKETGGRFDKVKKGRSPKGAFADFLIEADLRDDDAEYDVGGTP